MHNQNSILLYKVNKINKSLRKPMKYTEIYPDVKNKHFVKNDILMNLFKNLFA